MRAFLMLAITLLIAAIIGYPLVERAVMKSSQTPSRTAKVKTTRTAYLDTEAPAVPSRSTPGLQRSIFANGIVEGRQRELSLRFEMDGRLVQVDVEEGATVRKGDVLARLDPSTWNVDVAKAQANLARAQAELNLLLAAAREEIKEHARAQSRLADAQLVRAKKEFDRTSQLAQHNVSTGQELEQAKAAYETARAQHEAARAKVQEVEAPPRNEEVDIAKARVALEEANVRHARTMLRKTELRSPIDGIVLQRRGEPGELVGPASKHAIITMVDISEMRVRAFVEELDAVCVTVGSQAFVQADGMPGVRFRGRVVTCSPFMAPKQHYRNLSTEQVDVKAREIVVRLDEADQPERLIVGLPVDVYIRPTRDRQWN